MDPSEDNSQIGSNLSVISFHSHFIIHTGFSVATKGHIPCYAQGQENPFADHVAQEGMGFGEGL